MLVMRSIAAIGVSLAGVCAAQEVSLLADESEPGPVGESLLATSVPDQTSPTPTEREGDGARGLSAGTPGTVELQAGDWSLLSYRDEMFSVPELRYDLGRGWRLGTTGSAWSFDDRYGYYSISAEAAYNLTHNAGFVVGYDLYRVARPGYLDDLNLEREGLFAQFRLEF